MIVLVSGAVMAQPKARRNEAKDKQQTSNANSGMTLRAREMFPTALEMPQDVVWKRDIYREIDEKILKSLLAEVERGTARVDDVAKLIGLRKESAAKGGKVIIEKINDSIRNVFTMTGFYSLFEIKD